MKRKIKHVLFLLGIIICANRGFAQKHTIDSLKQLLKTERDDTNKVNTINILSENLWRKGIYDSSLIYANSAQILAGKLQFKTGVAIAFKNMGVINWYQSEYGKAIEYQTKALHINEEIGNQSRIAVNLRYIGNVYKEEGDYSKAMDYYLKALNINQEIGSKEGIAANLGNIGIIYNDLGDYPKALDYYLRALKIAEEIGEKNVMANNYVNIGIIYHDQGDISKSLDYYQKALEINEELGSKYYIAADLSNIGIIYSDHRDYTKALDYYQHALKIAEEIGSKDEIATSNDNIGTIYFDQKDFSKAMDYELKALKIAKEIGNKRGVAKGFTQIGFIHIKNGKFKEAEEYLKKAIALDDSTGILDDLSESEDLLSQLYDTAGRYKLALTYYKKSGILKDSLFNMDKKSTLTRKELSFQFEKKEAEGKAEQDKKDAKQKIILYSLLAGFLVMLIFSFLIYVGYSQKRKANIIITQKNDEVMMQKEIVEEKNKEILDSITYAKRLQDAILPPLSLVKQFLPDSFLLYKPKDIVAGDFYWMERSGNSILIAAADCTGHGVPGALVSVVCSNALNRTVKEFHIAEPGKILDKVRELVLETFEKSENNVQDGMDISLCCINTKTNQIQWSGAYNSLLYIQNGEIKELPADKQPIGKHDKPQPFNTHNLNLQKGDTLYLFTDGYADQFGGPRGKKFKYKQMEELLLSNAGKPMNEQKHILENTFDKWKGDLEQVDDILIIGIRV